VVGIAATVAAVENGSGGGNGSGNCRSDSGGDGRGSGGGGRKGRRIEWRNDGRKGKTSKERKDRGSMMVTLAAVAGMTVVVIVAAMV
jgi:hypothetical protein